MSTATLERVAKAIQDKMDGSVDDLELARAAIQALREPDDRLLFAADGWSDLVMGDGGDAEARRKEFRMIWKVQIDTILGVDLAGSKHMLSG